MVILSNISSSKCKCISSEQTSVSHGGAALLHVLLDALELLLDVLQPSLSVHQAATRLPVLVLRLHHLVLQPSIRNRYSIIESILSAVIQREYMLQSCTIGR